MIKIICLTKTCGSKGISDPIKVWQKNYFHLTHRLQIWNYERCVFPTKICGFESVFKKGFEQNIIKNYKNVIQIKKIKVWTTKSGACFQVYFKLKTWIVFFFFSLHLHSVMFWKIEKKYVADWVRFSLKVLYKKLRTNSIKPHQNRINLSLFEI